MLMMHAVEADDAANGNDAVQADDGNANYCAYGDAAQVDDGAANGEMMPCRQMMVMSTMTPTMMPLPWMMQDSIIRMTPHRFMIQQK